MIDKIRALLEPDVSIAAKLAAIALFIGRKFENQDGRLEALEARQLQKGDKGERGERGEKGEKGDRGDVGPMGLVGPVGPAGKDGKDGKKGKDGVSVVEADLDFDGILRFKLSNGNIIEAGKIDLEDLVRPIISTQVARNQVYVGPTPPDNPQLNDIWLQT